MPLPLPDLTARARRVRLLLLDVDGVLTDCSVTMGNLDETKTFSIRDGAAIVWARQCGLDVGLLSGRPSPATERRAEELGIEIVIQTGGGKREPFLNLLAERGLAAEEVAYMGDDLRGPAGDGAGGPDRGARGRRARCGRARTLGVRASRGPRRRARVHRIHPARTRRVGRARRAASGLAWGAVQDSLFLFGILIALLAGLAGGKAWERYKLREGRWVDRRKIRQSPHFILGLNHLVLGQVDLAIEQLEKAATLDPEALELRLVLGNLYREKGQVGRAIHEHQSLLQRPRLSRLEHANIQLCLGLDYRRGGFVDRAAAAFTEVLKLDPDSEAALANLEKLQEDQHQWQDAYVTRKRLAQLAGSPDQPKSQSILAFLENEIGLQALKEGKLDEAARRFEAAIDATARS